MSSFSDSDRFRQRRDRGRHRRLSSDSPDRYPTEPGSRSRRTQQMPSQHYSSRQRSHLQLPPPYPQRSYPDTDPSPLTAQALRRPILVDADETLKQKPAQRRARSNSHVKIQTSSDDELDYYRQQRAKSARGERRSRHDAERKYGRRYKAFQDKRDGYESEEGETLKKARQDRERREGRERRVRGRQYVDGRVDHVYALPLRGKAGVSERPGIHSAMVPPSFPSPPLENPRPQPQVRQDYRRHGAHENLRYDSRRHSSYEDRGYRSDGGKRFQDLYRYDQDSWGDYNDYHRDHRERREDGYRSDHDHIKQSHHQDRPSYRGYHSDYRDDRRDRSPRDRGRNREKGRHHHGNYYSKDRYQDYEYNRRGHGDYNRDRARRSRDRSRGLSTWQREFSTIFMEQAMPVIRKEGGKYLRKEMRKFLAKRQQQSEEA